VHDTCEVKSDDVKDSFYEELLLVPNQFPRYSMKILFSDFNVKVGKEDIFKSTVGNETSHETSKHNCVRVVNLATSENLVVKSAIFPHATFINTPGPLLMERCTTRLITF
jgi:hypothetical protein